MLLNKTKQPMLRFYCCSQCSAHYLLPSDHSNHCRVCGYHELLPAEITALTLNALIGWNYCPACGVVSVYCAKSGIICPFCLNGQSSNITVEIATRVWVLGGGKVN